MKKLVVMETHPVQYRVPVYQELARLRPGSFEVWYGTDCSVRGYLDRDFGVQVQWRQPLLEGYSHRIWNNQRGTPLAGFRSLHGRGVPRALRETGPGAVLFTSLGYEYDLRAFFACRARRIPIWIRQETQDEAFPRARMKAWLRSWVYRGFYRSVSHAFYIGELNRQHLLSHGVPAERMSRAPYCVANPLGPLSSRAKDEWRQRIRCQWEISATDYVVAFMGKLIPKKDPETLCRAVAKIRSACGKSLRLLFVGAGELEFALRDLCRALCLPAVFAGFINQDEMPGYALAADVVVLPSRRAGETWGLVINEALQAGCGTVVSSAVGCAAEFGAWERCRVFPTGDIAACGQAILELCQYPRDYDWATEKMAAYSVAAAAGALAKQMV